MNAVEDKSLFYWSKHRIKIANHLNNNTNFASQSNMSKLQWLMSNEDESICKDIASFVTKCFPLGIRLFCSLLLHINMPFSHMQ